MTDQPMYPYQLAATFLLSRGDPSYLAFDMGTGKSRTFIEAVKMRQAERVLILCPASAALVWKREIARWDPHADVIHATLPEHINSAFEYTIVTHGMFSQKNGNVIGALNFCRPFSMTAIDEAHAFNAADSQRVKALKKVQHKLGYIVPLSGTPMRNHAGDLYNMLLLCYPEGLKAGNGVLMHRLAFEDRYCRVVNKVFNTHHVRVIEGSKNLDVLRKKLAPFMVRVRKADVLKDLPPILWDQVPVPLNDSPFNLPSYDDIAEHLQGVGEDTAASLLESLSREPHIMKLRRLLGLAKLRGATEYIIDMLDNLPKERKVLVFAIHQDVISTLQEQLGEYSPATVTGSTPLKDRETAVGRFLTNPACRVFLGNIQAAGTALTLVGPACRCSDVVFAESSWTAADNAQAACRVHRIGQKDGVVVRMLTADNTVEELIHGIILRKSREFAQLFDSKGEVQ